MDELKQLKDKMVRKIARDFDDRDRIDPDMADALKDVSEAIYYCKVAESMDPSEPSGYQHMGYMPDAYQAGYQARDAQGRYMRGYGDPVEAVRSIMATATPDERERVRAEMRQM